MKAKDILDFAELRSQINLKNFKIISWCPVYESVNDKLEITEFMMRFENLTYSHD